MQRAIFGLVVLSVLMSAAAQVTLKTGLNRAFVGADAAKIGDLGSLLQMLSSPLVWVGLAVYFGSAIVWLYVLSATEVSTAYPFVSLGFVVTAVLGVMLHGDHVTAGKVIGTALIVAGTVVISRG